MSGNGRELINTDFVERFCIVEKPDAALVIASYNAERPPVTIAKYINAKEAKAALSDLFSAIAEDWRQFAMPDSALFYEQGTIKDARTKRKGGS